jgi:hypothetical protein
MIVFRSVRRKGNSETMKKHLLCVFITFRKSNKNSLERRAGACQSSRKETSCITTLYKTRKGEDVVCIRNWSTNVFQGAFAFAYFECINAKRAVSSFNASCGEQGGGVNSGNLTLPMYLFFWLGVFCSASHLRRNWITPQAGRQAVPAVRHFV